MVQHDAVAPLGHDRQLVASLVRPHAKAEEAHAQLLAHGLHLLQVTAGLGAGQMQVFQRRAGKLELAGGLEAAIAVRPLQRDDVLALVDRLPAVAGEPDQQRVDAALLLVGGGVVIAGRVDELLVLGADPPALRRLLAVGEQADQVVAGFDRRILAGLGFARAHGFGP